MQFRVVIRKEGASDETRVIDAPSHFAVYDLVRKEGGTVLEIGEGGRGFALPKWFSISFGSGIKRQEIIRLAKNMSAMLSAGLSLSRALSVIERQSDNKRLKAVATGLSESVKKGSSFHEALGAYPKVFPQLFVAMARAGEESGGLSDALSVVALQMERSEELARKVRGAMIYPAIVVTAIIIVGILMLMFVVPTLTATFEELGVEVPLTTQIIVSVSDFMVAHSIIVVLLILLFVVGLVSFARSRRGSALILAGALRMPVIGELVRETYTARAARTLSSLLASGVPVLDSLSIASEVVHARAFASVVDEATILVGKGEPLSAAFAKHERLYPILMSDMLAVGEETGKVADMLKQIAQFYEQDVADKTKDLSTIIEPILMLLIGAVVGVFAVSMITPIYSLSSAI